MDRIRGICSIDSTREMKQSTGVVSGREGGGGEEQCCCWHAAHSVALFRSLQPRAKWAVVQRCRPASACRFLLSPRRSDSSAYKQAAVLSPTPHSFAARVYRLVRPHSFTHNTIRARRRPTIPSVATLSRANSRSATITTAVFVRPLSAAYSWARFATVICP